VTPNTGVILFSTKTAKTPEQTATLNSFLADIINELSTQKIIDSIEENLLYLPLDLCTYISRMMQD
jgi:hypothetical protein